MLTGWLYGVRGRGMKVEAGAIVTPLGSFTFDPAGLTLVRALGLRDIGDVAMEQRASFIEAFRELGLQVEFDENV